MLNIQQIYGEFDKYINSDTNLVLGVSGGPDSILVFHIIEKYYVLRGFDLSRLHIAHFNHKFRVESDNEAKILKDKFQKYNFHYKEYSGNNFTENSLRKARWSFFREILGNFQSNKILVLGHNLTDRIETTFMNMLRGCYKDGFLNMGKFDRKEDYFVFRPLLSMPKDEILHYCDMNNIQYFIDHSNIQESISKRNFLRNGPIKQLINMGNINSNGQNSFLESFKNIYSILEKDQVNNFMLAPISIDPNWSVEFAYELKSQINNIQDLVDILKQLNSYANISQNNLTEIYNYLINSNKGYKYFNGLYMFVSHGKKYFIKGDFLFWQKRFADIKKIIKIGYININNYTINIDDKKYIGGELGFYYSFDPYIRGKLKKIFINKKIPIFKRMFTLVIIKDSQVIKVFEN